MNWSRRHSLIAGLALIALTNAVALGGAVYNRSGDPESTLRLSERELRPPYVWRDTHENSGLAMDLQWRVLVEDAHQAIPYLGRNQGGSPRWLDQAKMASLGFDIDLADGKTDEWRSARRELGRDVLLVLEFDGPAYQRSLVTAADAAGLLEARESGTARLAAQHMLDRERNSSSRLFVVDAGLDLAALRAKYPDRSKYAIVGGQVRPTERLVRIAHGQFGYVSALNVEAINVPLELRGAFEGAAPDLEYASTPASKVRYEATVAFGRRLEPWITGAARK